jgi:hypothetical protein
MSSDPLVGDLEDLPRAHGPIDPGWLTPQDGSKTSSRHDLPAWGSLFESPRGLPDIQFHRQVRGQQSVVLATCPGGGSGGDEETRTPDPLLAKEMLFRLSYVPLHAPVMRTVRGGRFWTRTRGLCLIRAVL